MTRAPLFLPPGSSRLLWTLGHLLMLSGLYLVIAMGGVYATVTYQLQVAHGDSDLPALVTPVTGRNAPLQSQRTLVVPVEPFTVPLLASNDGRLRSPVPVSVVVEHRSTVSRVVIPTIGVDFKVVEVGWDVVEEQGQRYAIWQVAEYAVGQHQGSANPGEGENIVLAAHVGGYGKVFKDLYFVKTGDPITIFSNGQQYLYTVRERLVVDEEGASEEQRRANAHLLAPSGSEMLTLITCWPLTGNDRFTQRVIVRALPYRVDGDVSYPSGPGAWSIR